MHPWLLINFKSKQKRERGVVLVNILTEKQQKWKFQYYRVCGERNMTLGLQNIDQYCLA